MKQLAALLLIGLLVLGSIVAIPTSLVSASSSSDEEEEEEETIEEETSGDEETTEEAPLPTPVPSTDQNQIAEQQPTTTTTAPSSTGPLTTEQLMQKYAANKTLPDFAPFNATAAAEDAAAANITGPKAVVLTFDDNWKSQISFAEPILAERGFNASFFVYCLAEVQGPGFMTAQDLNDLHNAGYDVQSHSMTHLNLSRATTEQLQFEVGESKACLQDMIPGLQVTTFAVPFAEGAQNATILQEIQDDGYTVGRAGYAGSFALNCAPGWSNQTAGCEDIFLPGTTNGTVKDQSRWNIPVADANGIGRDNAHELNRTQTAFVTEVNDGLSWDADGTLNALPVLVYHNFSDTLLPPDRMGQSLLSEAFIQQMDYLAENNFTALSLSDLEYNPTTGNFTIPKLDVSASQTQQTPQ